MKTLEIQDDNSIFIGISMKEEKDKINYVFLDKVYSKVESLLILSDYMDFSLHFEGDKFDVPNLKELNLVGKFALNIFQNMREDFLYAPVLEKMYFIDTELEQIPSFLKKNKTLKLLNFRHGDLLEIPREIFEMENLQSLSFHYLNKIRILPDEIKKLTNLVYFDLWKAPIEYLSHELFLLPKIESISFCYSSYTPTMEVLSALKEYKNSGKRIVGWLGYVD